MPVSFKYFLYITIILSQVSCAQQEKKSNPHSYTIDKSIKAEAEKRISREEGMIMGEMDVRLLVNGKELQSTFDKEKKIPFFIDTDVNNDLIIISGRAGLFGGFGFELYLKGDSAEILFGINSDDAEIYKLNKDDTTYQVGMQVSTINNKVVLSKKPNPKEISESNPLEGYIEFESLDFYQKSDMGGKDEKVKMFIKAYFKAGGSSWGPEKN